MITAAGLISVLSDATQPDLTTRQLALLMVLNEHERMQLKELAVESGFYYRGTVTTACDTLERHALVKRWWGNGTRVERWIAITAPGRRYLAALGKAAT